MKSVDLTGAVWRKSSHSNGQAECVEVAFLGDGTVGIRDSKESGDGSALLVSRLGWVAFQGGLLGEEFTGFH
ncbi:DUF397 domain-containing protein [Streptomyces sp. J2-1]|nr:DUF397 domain-containing protein [Streptomyces corallincola]